LSAMPTRSQYAGSSAWRSSQGKAVCGNRRMTLSHRCTRRLTAGHCSNG
jgi:hypothetical protein